MGTQILKIILDNSCYTDKYSYRFKSEFQPNTKS